MKNTTAKGARFEREILHFLNNKGYSVARAPSSGGWLTPVDVIAMKEGKILAIECKSHRKKPKPDQKQLQRFRDWCDRAGAIGLLAWQVPGSQGQGQQEQGQDQRRQASEWRFLRLEDAEAKRYDDENWFNMQIFMKVFCD